MIRFETRVELRESPESVLDGIFDTSNWTSFRGWGPLPGIRDVTLTMPGESRVGTVFDVVNTDGSRHRETVVEYVPGERLVMHMDGFTFPLGGLATHFVERWELTRNEVGTELTRSFELHPKGLLGRLLLPAISLLLRRAVRRHTHELVA